MPKFLFLLLLRSQNSLAMSTRESRSGFSLYLFKIVRLLNRSCLIVEKKHIFNLRSVENDLSPDALVAGFTNMSLHTEITLFMIFPYEEGNSLILTTMSSKHKPSPSFSNTFKIPTGHLTFQLNIISVIFSNP